MQVRLAPLHLADNSKNADMLLLLLLHAVNMSKHFLYPPIGLIFALEKSFKLCLPSVGGASWRKREGEGFFPLSVGLCRALLAKFGRISLYVTDDAIMQKALPM